MITRRPMIAFKAKVQRYTDADGIEREYVSVPELKRIHCDLAAFRNHEKYGSYANSDLFPGILKRIRETTFGNSGMLKLHVVPAGVSVDTTGFLAVVSFSV